MAVNEFCRQQQPPIGFIYADVRGLFAMLFVDLGAGFEVVDSTGEELKETYVGGITRAEKGVVTTVDNHKHGLEDGDRVSFREVKGMHQLNEGTYEVKVLGPYSFSIGDTTGFGEYEQSGIVCQLHRRQTVEFQSLASQLVTPSLLQVDFAKLEGSTQTLLGFRALSAFRAAHGRLPSAWDRADADEMLRLAEAANYESSDQLDKVDTDVIRLFSFTCAGELGPLCAAIGGWAAQEALKALTGKFSPLKQLICLDAAEVSPGLDSDPGLFRSRGDRYDSQRACLGDPLCAQLAELKLFMVGCGAIGCEMLKNYALLGIGTAAEGRIVITDNDLIEKSNLNRQFLFRPHHIQSPKSVVAAGAARRINPGMNIEAHEHKVGPETAEGVYNDEFFSGLDVVVNALDNIAARLFMDACCVRNQRPLLESGTMGSKGHVQVIVPHLTESYASQRDPPEADVPYCTLKSFPHTIEHTIQWSRDKFANLFELKPADYNKFWEGAGRSVDGVAAACRAGDPDKILTRLPQALKLARNRPQNWLECITMARKKFEKYFNHKARNLLAAFPLDTKLKDGSSFWQSPKRPPQPISFDPAQPDHIGFIAAAARLFAGRHNLTPPDDVLRSVSELLPQVAVPVYVPKSVQSVVTDEAVTKDQAEKKQGVDTQELGGNELDSYAVNLERLAAEGSGDGAQKLTAALGVALFEKDDDTNGHIDFITAASNLRATMYGIQASDRFKTKRIAGKIVPAIATTTAAVSGLVALELIKIVKKVSLDNYKNTFLNLALPFMLLSEPGPVEKVQLGSGNSYTLWDKWEIRGTHSTTLAEFLAMFKDSYGLEPTGVFNGGSMVYVPLFKGQQKRLPKPMRKLLKSASKARQQYVDLTVTIETPEGSDGAEDTIPPVRYFLGTKT